MRKGVTILGYYGADNAGDEAILQAMVEELRAEGINDITVLSRNPAETSEKHGVKSIYTGRRHQGLLDIYRQLRKSELFILGGGGLLQDHTARVVPYWLSRVFIARLTRTPVYYYAHGVGPLRTDLSRRLVRLLSQGVDYITVRDQQSLDILEELGVTKPRMELTADPAMTLLTTVNGAELLAGEGIKLRTDQINVALALRPWFDEDYQANLLMTLKGVIDNYDINLTFIPFQYGMDEPINEQMAAELEEYVRRSGQQRVTIKVLRGRYQPAELIAILKQYQGIIGMRLHALILGATVNRALFALSYDDKVTNFMERLQLDDYCYSIEEIAAEPTGLNERLGDWLNNMEQLAHTAWPHVSELRDLAHRNAQIASQLLEKGR